MSVVETVLVFVVIPTASLVVLWLLTMLPNRGHRPRYRNGEAWDHAPVWWSGNPEGIKVGYPTRRSSTRDERRVGLSEIGGGARGTW